MPTSYYTYTVSVLHATRFAKSKLKVCLQQIGCCCCCYSNNSQLTINPLQFEGRRYSSLPASQITYKLVDLRFLLLFTHMVINDILINPEFIQSILEGFIISVKLIVHVSHVVLRRLTLSVLIFNEPSRPTQSPMLSRMGDEYRASCKDSVWLDNEGRCGLFHR